MTSKIWQVIYDKQKLANTTSKLWQATASKLGQAKVSKYNKQKLAKYDKQKLGTKTSKI